MVIIYTLSCLLAQLLPLFPQNWSKHMHSIGCPQVSSIFAIFFSKLLQVRDSSNILYFRQRQVWTIPLTKPRQMRVKNAHETEKCSSQNTLETLLVLVSQNSQITRTEASVNQNSLEVEKCSSQSSL